VEQPLGDGADPFGEGAKVGVATCSLPVQQMGYQGAGCGLVADLLGRELLSGEQGAKRLVILVPLAVPTGHVNKILCAALQDRELCGVHALGVLDRGSPVAQGDRRRDTMDVDIGRSKRREPVIGIATQAARYRVGFAK
jgi:hypothetical protein